METPTLLLWYDAGPPYLGLTFKMTTQPNAWRPMLQHTGERTRTLFNQGGKLSLPIILWNAAKVWTHFILIITNPCRLS